MPSREFSASLLLPEVLREPGEVALQAVDAMRGLAGAGHAVALVRVADKLNGHVTRFERHEHLLGLLNGAAIVVLLVLDQERCPEIARIRDRGEADIRLHRLPRRSAELLHATEEAE